MGRHYNRDGATIIEGDAFAELARLPWKADDIVFTDPPYGTGGWRNAGGGRGDVVAFHEQAPWDLGRVDWVPLCQARAIVSFWPSSSAVDLLTAAKLAGYTKHRSLYWVKPAPMPQVNGRIRWAVEPIWVLGREGFTMHGGQDWLEATPPSMGTKEWEGHQYQKPLSVLMWIIGKLPRGARIIDPFMGSGSTLRAAANLGHPCVGIENDPKWFEIAVKRMSQQVLPGMEPVQAEMF